MPLWWRSFIVRRVICSTTPDTPRPPSIHPPEIRRPVGKDPREDIAHQLLGAEADSQPDDASPGQVGPDIDAQCRENDQSSHHHDDHAYPYPAARNPTTIRTIIQN